ncbi:MAG TPA: hypothetical protein VHB27_11960 [Rhodopila sp.]|uniref:hypothetical protein n=1 Tax=Rhodopila sp. TaxID=2480087 RepID=UPI002C37E2BC|nr:hypothetical protein [Rhodopila sp.]HVY15935.1 hypothetical protein [Rhodopila sp.]
MNLLPLFLVSFATVGYETALTRYFAIAKWSEYGYWVISMVMVGFAFSGVALALWRDALARRADRLFAALPPVLVIAAALGYHFTIVNPFNPLQLQNPVTWADQLWNIAGYYAALLPFFFLAGLFIGLSFIRYSDRIGPVYAADLAGAGAGAAGILALMYVVQGFHLVPFLLLPLALAGPLARNPYRRVSGGAAVLALVACEALMVFGPQAAYNEFKAIYAPLHTPDAKVLASIVSPRGEYQLLDDFTERVDTDISNNAGMMGIPGPPRSFGLYKDGNRIASLPMPGPIDTGYAGAALDALPYLMIPHARTMLIGGSGGFRPAEVRRLAASQVRVLEPEPELYRILRSGMGAVPGAEIRPDLKVTNLSPLADTRANVYDVIDVSSDFLDAAETNATAFSKEALVGYMRMLAPNGIVSIPVSIRDFPVYALRMLSTVRSALLSMGITDVPGHVLAYRSAWDVRILITRDAWSPQRIAEARTFCDDRSFDIVWYPGFDAAKARADLYNDLPAVSFDKGEVTASGPDDAIADEAKAELSGQPTTSDRQFNLSPITLDRPFFYAVLRLDRLGTILKRLEILPQQEIGALVNVAVLAQAAVIAVLVLLVPVLAPKRIRVPRAGLLRSVIYFPALALGFLFIEIYLIEKASFWFGDRISSFAVVLTGMLVFSGLGSLLSDRMTAWPRAGVGIAVLVVLAWCAGVYVLLQPVMLATMEWSMATRVGLLLMVIAPASICLGMPFPLGLGQAGSTGFLPWAWGLNGAFSVVATPLANLIAREAGFSWVLLCSAALYGTAWLTFPAMRKTRVWQEIAAPSHAAE